MVGCDRKLLTIRDTTAIQETATELAVALLNGDCKDQVPGVNYDFLGKAVEIDSDSEEQALGEAPPSAKGVPSVPPKPPNAKELLRLAAGKPPFDLGGSGSATGKPSASGPEAGAGTCANNVSCPRTMSLKECFVSTHGSFHHRVFVDFLV
jgi:hypothetical protein